MGIKEQKIYARCTKKEYNIIEKKAEDSGLSKSQFIIQACLNIDISTVTFDYKKAEILCSLQNVFNMLSPKISSTEYQKIRKELDKLWHM